MTAFCRAAVLVVLAHLGLTTFFLGISWDTVLLDVFVIAALHIVERRFLSEAT